MRNMSIFLDMKRKDVKAIFIEVPPKEHMRIKQLAAGMGISMQMFIRHAIHHYVKCPSVLGKKPASQGESHV